MSRDGWRKKASDEDGWGGRGGYMAAKVYKLEEQFQKDAPREKQKEGMSSSIFSGVAIYVNGYTDPSADELRRLMMLHGGQYHVYYSRSKTTHIVATNLPNSKIQELRGEKVVRPEWITDSIKAGRVLPYHQYQLYAKQKGLSFPSVSRQNQEGAARSTPLCNPRPSCGNSSTQIHPVDQELDIRLNGSWKNTTENEEGGLKQNGVHDGNLEENHGPVSRKNKDFVLTNGHDHAVNGALKPVEVSRLRTSSPQGFIPVQNSDGRRRLEPPASSSLQTTATVSEPPTHGRAQEKIHSPNHTGRIWMNGSNHSAGPSHNPSNHSGKPTACGPDAGIISEFFTHSRLHHISTWRNEFSEYVNSLQSRRQATGGAVFCGKDKLKKLLASRVSAVSSMPAPQVRQSCILHVDMDCFFVSVGIREKAHLKGKPVAVTSNRGPGRVAQRPGANPQMEFEYYQQKRNQYRTAKRDCDLEMTPSPEDIEIREQNRRVDQDLASLSMAEIASCSYEARQAGVRNGMFFGQAKQLCPELQAVPYDFQAYKEVATTMYETLASYTHNIEALSCDEALVDATSLLAELGAAPDELASAIRADVKEKTGCSASVGMGSNILLARMATRRAKPEGQYLLRPEEVDDFIRDQPVTSLPGVGRSMSSKLAALGVATCGDLQQVSMVRLQKEFGPRTGQTLFRFCRGLDDRPVRSEKERKSVSAEMNYNIRFTKVEEAEKFLTNLSMEVQKRLQTAGLKGRRVTLKVMMRKPGAPMEPAKYGGHGICDNVARTSALAQPTDRWEQIAQEATKLFHAMKLEVTDMRGVGLQVQQLEGLHTTPQDSRRHIRDLLLARRQARPTNPSQAPNAETVTAASNASPYQLENSSSTVPPTSPSDPLPGTSKGGSMATRTPKHSRTNLNLSIEVPSPSQVDHSVLDALPAELREQVEKSWIRRGHLPNDVPCPSTPSRAPSSLIASEPQPAGTLVLQIPNQHGPMGSTGIVLELPDFSQVDPEVFAALPRELQEELHSAYRRRETAQPPGIMVEQKIPLLQFKQPAVGRTKRRYKRRNTSPAKKGHSPLKRLHLANSPAKSSPSKTIQTALKLKDEASSLKDVPEVLSKFTPRPVPTLAGAFELSDIKTLIREWVTTITEPMEEDILQVVKYCTELVEDKDLEKLDLVIKYMKRLMQQSVESVWSMAFDFILDNVQVVVQQAYGSTLKVT
ncbi:DNA repair protein REV1 isoform X2 [Denticeps clupeoides]|uniref:DNA repair protein REV1 isoform X2 n=1 Tax=Denticeps clupeoides TaxID=299321 RepID=UPI0010A38609|nr:DNA repair protein REV1 isoform X2 [Denticeps clupeoides]